MKKVTWIFILSLLTSLSAWGQTITPTASGQVNVTDGLGGYTLQPYGSSSLPTAGGIGYPLKSTAAGTTYAAQSPLSIDPRDYGADFNGGSVADATTINGSNVITCANADCNFPSNIASASYIIFATLGNGSSCLDNPSITFGGALQTTVTGFTNANSITVSGNANTTGTATVCLAWFPKDSTTALNAAWLAGGCSISLRMPPGKTLFSAPIFQNLSGCGGSVNAGLAYPGQTVFGSGVGTTYLMPAPIFNYAGLSGNQGINCAVGNLNVEHWDNFAVYGLGERAQATQANTCLFMVGQATDAFRIDVVGWDGRGGGATLIGVNMIGIEDVWSLGGQNYFGSIATYSANFSQLIITSFLSGNAASVNSVCPFKIASTGQVTIIGNGMNACTDIEAGGVLTSTGSQFNGAAGDSFAVFVNGGWFNLLGNDAVNGNGIQMSASGAVVSATQTTFNGFLGLAGTTLYNNGRNTFTGTTNLNGTANIIPLSFNAASPTISSGFGTSAAVSAANGPAAFTLSVGTGGTATNGVIGLPAATTAWACQAQDLTTQSATVFLTRQIASTTTTATIANFNTAGTQAAWVASDSLQISCFAH
jgi:hypothetical protein